MSLLSGCVLPLSPEFQDPPAPQNYAPQILDTRPLQGSIVASTGTFEITVTDPNLTDDLWIRWIAEYPPFSINSHSQGDDVMITHSVNGSPLQATKSVSFDCISGLAPVPQHPIMALVADRAFLPRDTPNVSLETLLTGLSDPVGLKTEAHWVLNLDCTQ